MYIKCVAIKSSTTTTITTMHSNNDDIIHSCMCEHKYLIRLFLKKKVLAQTLEYENER